MVKVGGGGIEVQDLSQLGVQTQPVPAVEVMLREGSNLLVLLLLEVVPAGECSDCSPVLGILPKNAVTLSQADIVTHCEAFSKWVIFLIHSLLVILLLFWTHHLAFLGKFQIF